MTYRLHQLLSDQLKEELLPNLQQMWQKNKAELVTLQMIPPNEMTTIEGGLLPMIKVLAEMMCRNKGWELRTIRFLE